MYRHYKVSWQHRYLVRAIRGHDAYYARTGNHRQLKRFRHGVTRRWYHWLSRRSGKRMGWDRFNRLLTRYPLPAVRIVHSVYRAANP